MLDDALSALRSLARGGWLAIAAVLTLALGIGSAIAIFSVVEAVMLKPLPFSAPGRLQVLEEVDARQTGDSTAPANFLDWRKENKVFTDLAAFRVRGMTLTGLEEPLRLDAASVTPNFFALLGSKPWLGRTFDLDPRSDEREVVLGYSLWRNRLGANRALLGKGLRIDGVVYTVTGVLAPDFFFLHQPEFYVRGPRGLPTAPAQPAGSDLASLRGLHYLNVVGRLRPGVTAERARVEMAGIARRLAAAYPDTNKGRSIRVSPLTDQALGNAGSALLLLSGAIGLVLLIACANVTNLLLVQVTTRERELAIRSALGADRARLTRQLMGESLLLALAGAGLGLLLASWTVHLFIGLSPFEVPRLEHVEIDGGVLAFSLLLALLTGLLVGGIPAMRAGGQDLQGALREGGSKASTGRRHRRLLNLFVVGEIAVTLALLVSTGLLVKSLLRIGAVAPGFEPHGVLTMRINLPPAKYADPAHMVRFFEEVVGRVRALPGVTSAAAATDLPATEGLSFSAAFVVRGRPRPRPGEEPQAVFHTVTPGYFRTLRIPLLAGRDLDDRDRAVGEQVLVIGRRMAEHLWPGADPLGQQIGFDNENGTTDWFRIVGLVGDVKSLGLERPTGSDVYSSFRQTPEKYMSLAVRTAGDPLALAAAVKRQVLAVDPEQPIDRLGSLDQLLAAPRAERRFIAALLATLAAIALLLAVMGTYGVMTYAVAQRTHEMGIRMALGAPRGKVSQLVVVEAGMLALAGVGLGLVGTLALTRALSRWWFGVGAADPLTFVTFSLGLILVAILASYLPSRRVMKIDPMQAVQNG